MAIVETVTISIGASVAKWIIGSWLGHGLPKDVASRAIDDISKKVPDFIEQRRLRRQMEQIAELSARKLASLIEVEFRGLPENEAEAAVHAVSSVMSSAIGK